MSQPPDGSALWHLLCVGLVPIADMDPAFARLALDPETWRAIVLGDREIDEETRWTSSAGAGHSTCLITPTWSAATHQW